MSKESYVRGFCKAAEAAGVDPVALAKYAQLGAGGERNGPTMINAIEDADRKFSREASELQQALAALYPVRNPKMINPTMYGYGSGVMPTNSKSVSRGSAGNIFDYFRKKLLDKSAQAKK